MGISKLLDKVNQAKSAVNSVKGIQNKLKNIDKTSVLDQLGEQAEEAKRTLEKRRSSLEKNLDARNAGKAVAKATPASADIDLIYPVYDQLENYIVFETRARTARDGKKGMNLLSKDNVSIALYLRPEHLSSNYAVNYKTQGFGAGMRGLMDAFDGGSSGDFFGEGGSLEKFAGEVKNMLGSAINKMANSATGDMLNFSAGRAINPMEEQMLEGIGFRSFSFQYEFYPRSEAEADMVQQIMYYFRTAMLPDTYGTSEVTDNENFFNYPNVFDVSFDGPIAERVDGFMPMVCTGCDITHGDTELGYFSNGQPTKSSMKIDFVEIKIVTQENFQKISPIGDKSITPTDYSITDRRTSGKDRGEDPSGGDWYEDGALNYLSGKKKGGG